MPISRTIKRTLFAVLCAPFIAILLFLFWPIYLVSRLCDDPEPLSVSQAIAIILIDFVFTCSRLAFLYYIAIWILRP